MSCSTSLLGGPRGARHFKGYTVVQMHRTIAKLWESCSLPNILYQTIPRSLRAQISILELQGTKTVCLDTEEGLEQLLASICRTVPGSSTQWHCVPGTLIFWPIFYRTRYLHSQNFVLLSHISGSNEKTFHYKFMRRDGKIFLSFPPGHFSLKDVQRY